MTTPNLSRPLLYTYRRCPYAMRARMALLRAGVPFDAHEIVLRDKPSGLKSLSPKGTVPVLALSGGCVIEQSWDIVEWALTQSGAHPSVRAWWDRAQLPDAVSLLAINDGEFKQHLDRYKYPERFVGAADASVADVRDCHRSECVKLLLEPLERALQRNPFLCGPSPCATDIGIFPFIRQLAAIDRDWFDALPLPKVQDWLALWLNSALFAACMVKLPSNTVVAYESAALPALHASPPQAQRPS